MEERGAIRAISVAVPFLFPGAITVTNPDPQPTRTNNNQTNQP